MKDKNEKSSGDFSRHHDSSFINAFGDKITAAIAEKAEKRVRTGMGLREQEQVLHVLLCEAETPLLIDCPWTTSIWSSLAVRTGL